MIDMTKCKLCGKEKFSKTCVPYFIKIEGKYFDPVPYVPLNKTIAEVYRKKERRCSGCGVAEGGYHHVGCPVEMCPRCSNTWVSCRCQGQKLILSY